MKPNFRLEASLVDNSDQFTDPFFQRFKLRPAPTPLELKEGLSKTYLFPTFYGGVTCAIAIFMCDYNRAEAMMPHPSMTPVRMPRGRAVVIFSCYEYRNVMNVGPYNEIAMTIPVMVRSRFSPPVLPLLINFKKKGYYVFSMPVTSLENQIRGTKIWGLPKVVEEINISTSGNHYITVAKDEDGEVYFELSIPKSGMPRHFDETGFLYSIHNSNLLKSQMSFKGDFNMNSNFSSLWNKGTKTDTPVLKLGDSPRAATLVELQIEQVPFQTRFANSMNSCLDLPLVSR